MIANSRASASVMMPPANQIISMFCRERMKDWLENILAYFPSPANVHSETGAVMLGMSKKLIRKVLMTG